MPYKELFLKRRRDYIESRFADLNPTQREAALNCDGPLLILAGAGSGKTTVVVNRIRALLMFGNAYVSDNLCREVEKRDLELLEEAFKTGRPDPDLTPLLRAGGVKPWNVLAITFTNKAAGELKDRIAAAVGDEGLEVAASTFHSACVRFLRRWADRIGYSKSFTIYDTDDSRRVVKDLLKALEADERMWEPKKVLGRISALKDKLTGAEEFAKLASEPADKMLARFYLGYQKRLREADAMDFDDLIFNAVRLLESDGEARDYYHRRFRYIMVDEYQDTSLAQFRLVQLLTGPERNLCVVGDDDQSIYRFRGATIENILGFERQFPGAKVVRLEQNYRSTGDILDAANAVIANNLARKGKTLWTASGSGEKVRVYCAEDEQDEARFVAADIIRDRDMGIALKDHAVLYRMNAQSNAIETFFARAGIPYRVVGGQRFYDRAEIKDIISYMSIVLNPRDDLRLTRIINRPARKIGAATVETIAAAASGLGVPMLEIIEHAADFPSLSRAAGALGEFYKIYSELRESAEEDSLADFVETVISRSGYRMWLLAQGDEGRARLDNVEELMSNVVNYEKESEEPSLSEFLETVALVSDIDSYDQDADAVVLMTLHSAKGLEFNSVYIVGLEEGVFPGEMSRYNTDDVEEERRLAYVGITRARKRLTLTRASARMLFGMTRRGTASRFLEEIPENLREELNPRRARPAPAPKPQRRPTVPLGAFAASAAAPRPQKSDGSRFSPGDEVSHGVFGQGRVLSAQTMGGDTLLEIDFGARGRKKLMANYAQLKKTNGE